MSPERVELGLTSCRSQEIWAAGGCSVRRLHVQNRPFISNHPRGLPHLKTKYYIPSLDDTVSIGLWGTFKKFKLIDGKSHSSREFGKERNGNEGSSGAFQTLLPGPGCGLGYHCWQGVFYQVLPGGQVLLHRGAQKRGSSSVIQKL